MQKHPMVSVKEAAAALGCDERWVREKLNQGQLKGEKKTIGMKEKWFVYKGEIDAALAKRGQAATVLQPDNKQYFGVDEEVIDVVEDEAQDSRSSHQASLEEVIRLIANQFAEKLEDEKLVKLQLQKELEEKERQLRLLPDLQKQAEQERKAAEIRALEIEALSKQIAALEEERHATESKLEKVESLESQVSALNEQLRQLQKPWWKKWFMAQID